MSPTPTTMNEINALDASKVGIEANAETYGVVEEHISVSNNPFKKAEVSRPPSGIKKAPQESQKSVLDILRNFDSTPKTEKILFTSERKLATKRDEDTKKHEKVTNETSLTRTSSVSDKRRLFETVPESAVKQIQRSFLVQKSTVEHEKSIVEIENSCRVSERTKAFEEPVEANKLTRSMSIVERKKLFAKTDAKPILPPSKSSWSLQKSSIVSSKQLNVSTKETGTAEASNETFKGSDSEKSSEITKNVSSIISKFQFSKEASAPPKGVQRPVVVKPSNPEIGIKKSWLESKSSSTGISMALDKEKYPIKDVQPKTQETLGSNKDEDMKNTTEMTPQVTRIASVSSMINKFQTNQGTLLVKPKIEIQREKAVSHYILKVEQGIDNENELESKRSDSGAFVEDKRLNLETKSTLDIPKIDIGSIFDTEDSWMSSLLQEPTLATTTSFIDEVDVESLVAKENTASFVCEEKKSEEIEEPSCAARFETKEQELQEPSEVSTTSEETKIVELPVQTSSSTVELPCEEFAIKKGTKKKSVSFAVAWDGSLTDYKYFARDLEESNGETPTDAKGILLIKLSGISDIIPNPKATSRTMEFEVSQGSVCVTAPSVRLEPYESTRSLEWECGIPIVDGLPLHFTMTLHDFVEPETKRGILRSQSVKVLKDNLRSFGNKFTGFQPTRSLKHSDSVTSFNSISSLGFQVESNNVPKNTKEKLKIGQFTICDILDWTKSLTNVIEPRTLNLYKTDWEQSSRKLFSKSASGITLLGKLQIQAIFLPAQKTFGVDLLPSLISEYRNDLSTVSLHNKVWKEGFLYQKGGDCEVSYCNKVYRRRFFKLVGNCLVAYHETTLEERYTIQLHALENIEYATVDDQDPTEFALEFRDGRSLKFKVQEDKYDEMERNEWVQIIDESHQLLRSNPIPAWTTV